MAAERDPCPGCGRLIAYRMRSRRSPDDQARVDHHCPHGRPCIGWRHHVERGGFDHWQACAECCEAARLADGTVPSSLDCWSCTTPLPFDPAPLQRFCPPTGIVKVTGVLCAKCGAESVYHITLDGYDRYRGVESPTVA